MDEKTAELRDLFVEVTDAETVTESQTESPGTLAREVDVEERLASLVARMREDCGFATTLSDDDLITVVRGYYDGASDTDIARNLGDASRAKTVARARLDLHLLRDADRDPPFDFDAFRAAVDDADTASLADRFDVSESTVRYYRRVVDAQREARRVNDQYREEFENLLLDRELSENLTASSRQDGLEDATDGQEVDVSF